MKYVPLQRSGIAFIYVSVSSSNGLAMVNLRFLWDTGATQTTIPKSTLIDELGYTEDYIIKHKIPLQDKEKPLLADGTRPDLYKIPAMRMNIGGYELQSDYIYTSDTISNLSLLLGFNILRNFKFTFDIDASDEDAPHGKLFYELRKSCAVPFSKLNESFAHQLNDE
jgi:hypothetical protein